MSTTNPSKIKIIITGVAFILAIFLILFSFVNNYNKQRDNFINKSREAIFIQEVIADMFAEEYGFGGKIPSGKNAGYEAQHKYSENKIPNFSKELSTKIDEYNEKTSEAKQISSKLSRQNIKIADQIFDYLRQESDYLNDLVRINESLEESLSCIIFSSERLRCDQEDNKYQSDLLSQVNKQLEDSKKLNLRINDKIIELQADKHFLLF